MNNPAGHRAWFLIGSASPFFCLLDAQNGAPHPEKIVGTRGSFPHKFFEPIFTIFRRPTALIGVFFMPVVDTGYGGRTVCHCSPSASRSETAKASLRRLSIRASRTTVRNNFSLSDNCNSSHLARLSPPSPQRRLGSMAAGPRRSPSPSVALHEWMPAFAGMTRWQGWGPECSCGRETGVSTLSRCQTPPRLLQRPARLAPRPGEIIPDSRGASRASPGRATQRQAAQR